MAPKILAIDDHPETLDIIVSTLRSHGFEVTGTRSPVDSLSLAKEVQPDLVLVDMNMPQMNGYEVTRRLRAMAEFAEIPIIMFTAEEEVSKKIAGFESGVDDYLTKPAEPLEMIDRIETMLEASGVSPAITPSPPQDPANEEPRKPDSATIAFPQKEHLTAVVGGRGGAGTTTVAINLAMLLAQVGLPTTLLDLDMVQGHIAGYLQQSTSNHSLNVLAKSSGALTERQVQEQAVSYGENLRLLLSRSNLDGRLPTLTASQTGAVLDLLLKPGHMVVTDIGRGVCDATQPVLDRADQVILCLTPERVALAAGKTFLKQLEGILFPHTRLSALIFSPGKKVDLPQDVIEGFLGYPVLAVVPAPLKELVRAVNKGHPLVELYPKSDVTRAFQHITKQLVGASQ
jgi:pilus assembly protein CpaE